MDYAMSLHGRGVDRSVADRSSKSDTFEREKTRISLEDAPFLLAAALLHSLAEDLGTYRRKGFWDVDPAEMRGRGEVLRKWQIDQRMRTPDELVDELEGPSVRLLSDAVRVFAPSSTMGSRGGIVRMARAMSEDQRRMEKQARKRWEEVRR
ncbi:MAG: hypothetical protein ACYS26_13435 [Planctomycetota bacterium]